MEPTTINARLKMSALSAAGHKSVEGFVGGATQVKDEDGGKEWAGFVSDARIEGDEIVLSVHETAGADDWTPS